MKTLNFQNGVLPAYLQKLLKVTGSILMVSCMVLLYACKKDKVNAEVTSTPALTASANSVMLSRNNAEQPGITFSWSAATVNGMNGSVSYFLQWDRKGNNFANPANIKIGKDILKVAYTQGSFNNLVSTLPAETVSQIEMRVVGATSDGSVAPFYSNVIILSVTPYAQAIPPPFSQLWLVGDAAPSGWNIDNPTVMTQDGTDPYLFTYTGNLTVGEFKIPTAKSWDAQFYRPVINHQPLTDTKVQLSAGNPDNKWQITKASKYKITLNLHDLSISIVDMNVVTTPPPYSQLWVVGDATPTGWSLDSAISMVQDSGDQYVFTYTSALTAGDFKIATAKSFDKPFYRPVTSAPDLTDTHVQLNAGGPDNKWHITTAGNYKITLNLRSVTINIVKL